MRDFVVVLSIIIFVFVGGYLIEMYLKNIENNLISKIEEIIEQIKANDFNHIEKVEELFHELNKSKTIWHLVENHEEIDEIESELIRFLEVYQFENKQESILSASEVIFRIKDMLKGEKLELANIL